MVNQFHVSVYNSKQDSIFYGTVPLGTPVPRVGEYVNAPGIENLLVKKVVYSYSNNGTAVRITADEK
jgi:hypothetical protein